MRACCDVELGSTWMRITCSVYNEMADLKLIGRTVLEELANPTATVEVSTAGAPMRAD